MNKPQPQYRIAERESDSLPSRAVNLARRVLELERQCAGRGRLAFEVIFVDGEWLFLVSKPGPVERLGE